VHEEDRHSIEDYFAALAKISARHPVSVKHLTWKVWGGSRVKTHGHLVEAALRKLLEQDRIRRTVDGLFELTSRSPVLLPTPPGGEEFFTKTRTRRVSNRRPAVQQSEVADAAREGARELEARGDVLAEVAGVMGRIPDLLTRLEAEAAKNNERHDQIRAAHQALTVARDTFHIWSR
jgi:hypothetical protein